MLLYLLFEHKSYRDPWVAFQILKYLVRIWELYLKQHPKVQTLPVILPLVIYHAEDVWNVDTRFSGLFKIPEEFKPYIPNFEYRLFDVSHMSDQEIKGHVLLRIILMAFKYVRQPDFQHRMPEIFKLFREIESKTKGLEYLEILLKYIGSCVDAVSYDEVRNVLDQAFEEGGDVMPTIAQHFIEKGIERTKRDTGRNALEMGFNLEAIAKLTGDSLEKVSDLAAQLKAQKTATQ